MKLKSIEDAINEIKRIVLIYNSYRPHASLDMKTPEYAHSQSGVFKKHWKSYYKTVKTAVSY